MKRTLQYVKSVGIVECDLEDGGHVRLPVVPGILKHPTLKELPVLLRKESVAKKYTALALRKAPWQVVREFPRDWLEMCIPDADLRPGRLQALRFLMS